MADALRRDIYGSSLTVGVIDARRDRADRNHIFDGITASDQGLKDAIQGAIDDTGPWHHQITNLPLQTVTATRFRETAAFITQNYGRTQFTLPHPPGNPIVQMEKSIWPTDWVRGGEIYLNGYPEGEIPGVYGADKANPNLDRKPKDTPYHVSAIRMTVPTVLSWNPYGQVSSALGCVNKNALSFEGVTIPAGLIRFDALYVNGKKITSASTVISFGFNTTQFKIVYEFTLVPNGFLRQDVWFGDALGGNFPSNPAGDAGRQWRTRRIPVYQFVKFPAFPAG